MSKNSRRAKARSSSKKILKSMRLQNRVEELEKLVKALIENREQESRLQASMLFNINGLVSVLSSKDVITMSEFDTATKKVIEDFKQERVRQVQRCITAEKHNYDPIHYDSTVDKWFVFSPDWENKLGPFLSREAAAQALAEVTGQSTDPCVGPQLPREATEGSVLTPVAP